MPSLPRGCAKRDKSQLPIDIIRLLFDYAAVVDPPRRRDKRSSSRHRPSLGWIKSTHVCRSWRDVGLGMKPLWAAIATALFSPSAISTFLSRAGSCPLTISLPADNWWHWQELRASEVMSLMTRHIPRAGVLTMDLIHLEESNALPFSLPDLYEINVTYRLASYSIDTGKPFLHVLNLHTPSLRSATLKDTTLSPDSVQSLRELHLTLSNTVWASDLNVVHDFIRTCSQLETLHMELPQAHTPATDYRARDILLSNLKRATLSSDSARAICDTWWPIIARDDIILHIHCKSDRYEIPLNAMSALFDLCAAQLLSERYDAMDLDIEINHGLRITLLQQPACLSWTLFTASHDRGDLLCTLPRHIRAELIRSLSLSTAFIENDRISDVFDVLGSAMCGLTELKLSRMNQTPVSLHVRALGKPGKPEPAFSALQRLSISDVVLWGTSDDPAHSLAQHWWNVLNGALSARGVAFRLHHLVLEGSWSHSELWDMGHDGEELRKVLSLGLAQEVVDMRTFIIGDSDA